MDFLHSATKCLIRLINMACPYTSSYFDELLSLSSWYSNYIREYHYNKNYEKAKHIEGVLKSKLEELKFLYENNAATFDLELYFA